MKKKDCIKKNHWNQKKFDQNERKSQLKSHKNNVDSSFNFNFINLIQTNILEMKKFVHKEHTFTQNNQFIFFHWLSIRGYRKIENYIGEE